MNNNEPWGWSTSINIYNCEIKKMTDIQLIKKFVDKLVNLIGVEKYGSCQIVDFEDNSEITGYSVFQLIGKSHISIHFCDENRSIYLDILSQKIFDPLVITILCKTLFEGEKYTISTNERY